MESNKKFLEFFSLQNQLHCVCLVRKPEPHLLRTKQIHGLSFFFNLKIPGENHWFYMKKIPCFIWFHSFKLWMLFTLIYFFKFRSKKKMDRTVWNTLVFFIQNFRLLTIKSDWNQTVMKTLICQIVFTRQQGLCWTRKSLKSQLIWNFRNRIYFLVQKNQNFWFLSWNLLTHKWNNQVRSSLGFEMTNL